MLMSLLSLLALVVQWLSVMMSPTLSSLLQQPSLQQLKALHLVCQFKGLALSAGNFLMLAMKLCPWKFLLCLSLTALSIFYHHNKLPLATTWLQPMAHGLAMDLLLSSFTMALSSTLPMMLKVICQCVGLLQDVTNLMLFVVPLPGKHLSLLYRLLPI